ncbi:MAG: GNAT family protein, partial [Thermomicrobiales bacterium]
MSAATITKETEPISTPGAGHEGQTFLVGDEVYLRGPEEEDAKVGMSWRPTLFPIAPDLTEEWIKDDLAKDDNSTLIIVRKADDLVVGSLKVENEGLDHWLQPRVDALYGDRGLRWKAEAIVLAAQWLIHERGQPVVHLELPGYEQIVIEAIEKAGMRQTACFREMLQRDVARVDRLEYEYLSPEWLANLGDPNEA